MSEYTITQKQADNLNAWIDELGSGNYEQTNHVLKVDRKDEPAAYCCLGVAAEFLGVEQIAGVGRVTFVFPDGIHASGEPPRFWMAEQFGLPWFFVVSLMLANDDKIPFRVIARMIRIFLEEARIVNEPAA